MSSADVEFRLSEAKAGAKFVSLVANKTFHRGAVPDTSKSPWAAIARLDFVRDNKNISNGSGFLVAPGVILTARHNMKQIYDRLDILLGYDGTLNKGVRATYRGKTRYHPTRDIAVLLVDPVPIEPFQMGVVPTAQVALAGYPEGSARQMAGEGACRTDGPALFYDIDVGQGDSGAPVFLWDGNQAKCVAVHRERRYVPAAGKMLGAGELLDGSLIAELRDLVQSLTQ